ncbi:hypothetical protein IQ06DRAFT_303080 [Phaeosphaeriaceae sp. SRC1lsM3a]|nr:hypothetical protein IQ06DRAFT_303080 [Stagonospora sp. SRC1lsM3a]
MHLVSLFLFYALASCIFAFTIDVFTGHDCTGTSRRLNVRDNICASVGNFDTLSAWIVAYGSSGQRARVYTDSTCASAGVLRGPWFADRPNDSWRVGNCIDFGGQVGRSFSSFPA